MTTDKKVVRRPFHEVMVTAIAQSTCDNTLCLMQILRETQIEEGHEDEIIEAMEKKWNILPYWQKQVEEIKADLLAQKRPSVASISLVKGRRQKECSLLVLAQ